MSNIGSYIPATTSMGQATPVQTTGNGGNVPATALGQTATTMPAYPQSQTITPLPADKLVVPMTKEEIRRLVPFPESPKVVFGKLRFSERGGTMGFSVTLGFSATLGGVERNSPLAKAIHHQLSQELKRGFADFSAVEMKESAGGTDISLVSTWGFSQMINDKL